MTTYRKTPLLQMALLGAALALSACGARDEAALDKPALEKPSLDNVELDKVEIKKVSLDKAAVDIGLLEQGGAATNDFTTPVGFKQGDKLVAYEGPGWESDKVAYRLYLDGRNAVDIFGKRTPDLVLSTVGRGEDYHAMADWGMDILKVGASVGVGGVGVFENGALRQIGNAESYRAQVIEDSALSATLRVTHKGSQACGGDVATNYTIKAGSRLTHVKVNGACELPFGTGLVIHPDTVALASDGTAGWQYKARWGVQSLSDDNLGFALFYRYEDASTVGVDNDDDYIVFGTPAPDYAFGAAWSQEGVGSPDAGGITTQGEFESWLIETAATLNTTRPY